jgi:hypothetical protein
MKVIYAILTVMLNLATGNGADLVSIEKFKTIHGEGERLGVIATAPPEQRPQLLKIHAHLTLLEHWGERELKYSKEKAVAQISGFVDMENIIHARDRLWDLYLEQVRHATEKAGVTSKERDKIFSEVAERYNAPKYDLPIVHALALNIAPSSEALKLEGTIEALDKEWKHEFDTILADSNKKVTDEELRKIDRQLDEIFEKVKTLPTLSPEEVQKEYNEFPEELLYERRYPIRG